MLHPSVFRMLRSTLPAAAAAIPRGVWDPKQHNHKHVDSYAKAISDRRQWPAKKWSVGLEPRVLSDWSKFSLRNLAYEYNGKLRSCASFPEMVPIYQEMKLRGVEMDADTANVMLSRGARFPKIRVEDLFSLFDEFIDLGVRPDNSVVEILHTLWDFTSDGAAGGSRRDGEGESSQKSVPSLTWKESRRLQLVGLYDTLCRDEVETLGEKGFMDLLQREFGRYANNAALLGGRLSPETYCLYFSFMDSAERLFEELGKYLCTFVPKSRLEASSTNPFPVTELRYINNVRIPHLYKEAGLSLTGDSSLLHSTSAAPLNRPTNEPEHDPSFNREVYRSKFVGDVEINTVLTAVVARLVDSPLRGNRLPRTDEGALLLLLEKFVRDSGILLTSDLLAAMMEVCKFQADYSLERVAMRLLQCSLFGSAVLSTPQRQQWVGFAEEPMDGRVVGRYLASRDPWSVQMIHPLENGKFGVFRTASGEGVSAAITSQDARKQKSPTSRADAEEVEEESAVDTKAASSANDSTPSPKNDSKPVYTAAAIKERWSSVQELIKKAEVLQLSLPTSLPNGGDRDILASNPAAIAQAEADLRDRNIEKVAASMEVFTGMAAFLRHIFLHERYPPTEASLRASSSFSLDPTQAAGGKTTITTSAPGMTVEACEAIFACMRETKDRMDSHISACQASGWLGVKDALPELEAWETLLTLCTNMLDFLLTKTDQAAENERDNITKLFKEVGRFRGKMLEESRSRFDGRFKMLWLQEM